jgi:hypothetical protein
MDGISSVTYDTSQRSVKIDKNKTSSHLYLELHTFGELERNQAAAVAVQARTDETTTRLNDLLRIALNSLRSGFNKRTSQVYF